MVQSYGSDAAKASAAKRAIDPLADVDYFAKIMIVKARKSLLACQPRSLTTRFAAG